MSKGQSLQDPFLNALRKDRIPVSIFLVNGIKLQGQIESFDQYVVLLKNTVSQMVYKHAISTVVPTRNPRTEGGATPTTAGYQNTGSIGVMSSGTYPNAGFDRNSSFERNNFSTGTRPAGGFTRTTPAVGFDRNSGFERGGYQGGMGMSNTGFDRGNVTGFERSGFDRSGFEERGFDGKSFEGGDTRSFNRAGFDHKADNKFEDDEFDH